MSVPSETFTAKLFTATTKGLYGLLCDVRILIVRYHLRVKVHQLRLKMSDAYFRVGKKAFEAGLGDADLIAKIASLTRLIESLNTPKSSNGHLRTERRRLTIQMGKEVADTTSGSTTLAPEVAVARDLAARQGLLLTSIAELNTQANDGQSLRNPLVIGSLVLSTAMAMAVFSGGILGGVAPENKPSVKEANVAQAELAVPAKHRRVVKAGADKGPATRAYLYQFYSRNAAFTTELGAPYKVTRESTDLTALESAYRRMARLSADEAAALRKLDASNVDLRVGQWVLDWAAFLTESSLHYAAYANLIAETRNVQTYYSSGEGMVESIIRGADGDPFGTTRDSIAHKHRLQRDFEALRKTDQEFAKEEARHMAAGDALKLYLFETYPTAFSQ